MKKSDKNIQAAADEFNRDMMDLAAAKLLHGKGKFSTLGEAVDWIKAWREKESSIKDLPPEKRKEALENLTATWKEMIPPGSEIEEELQRLFMKIINSTEERDQLRKEVARIQEEWEQDRERAERAEKELARVKKGIALKKSHAKMSQVFLSSLFATEDTLIKYHGQMELRLGKTHAVSIIKKDLSTVITQGYKPLSFTAWQTRAIKALFSLCDEQNADYSNPTIVLNNISQFCEEALERKVTKKHKDGHTFKDFSGGEVNRLKQALQELSNPEELPRVICRGRVSGANRAKGNGFFYMEETPIIKSIKYLQKDLTEEQMENMTGEELKKSGQISITILPEFLRDWKGYWKFLPKDISKEIREACPDVKKVTKYLRNFIDYLHIQENPILRRTRKELFRAAKFNEADIKKRGKSYYSKVVFKYYDIATRSGYLTGYELDQKGTADLVDVLHLNENKYYHLAQRAKKKQLQADNTKNK